MISNGIETCITLVYIVERVSVCAVSQSCGRAATKKAFDFGCFLSIAKKRNISAPLNLKNHHTKGGFLNRNGPARIKLVPITTSFRLPPLLVGLGFWAVGFALSGNSLDSSYIEMVHLSRLATILSSYLPCSSLSKFTLCYALVIFRLTIYDKTLSSIQTSLSFLILHCVTTRYCDRSAHTLSYRIRSQVNLVNVSLSQPSTFRTIRNSKQNIRSLGAR